LHEESLGEKDSNHPDVTKVGSKKLLKSAAVANVVQKKIDAGPYEKREDG
jgi:hypothetical protein